MKTALIGHTGFVGSNLAASYEFDDVYNSSNIAQIEGREYDLVVSAASRADSHRINADPAPDLAQVREFVGTVSKARIGTLVLASTVCLWPQDTSPLEGTAIEPEKLTPYGANRAVLESMIQDRFSTLTVRLPQLFGANMKKGIVYDLLNNYRVEYIKPHSRFQYYDLARLWRDIQTALDSGMTALNLATPALRSVDVAREVFNVELDDQLGDAPLAEDYTRDMRTEHAEAYGGPEGYLMSASDSMSHIARFVMEARAGRSTDTQEGK